MAVTVQEQAGCPVEDFLFREGATRHYYQLKDDLQITWGEGGSKLKKEYVAQKAACDAQGGEYTLTVVVSHDHRKASLDENVPAKLKDTVVVFHFPAVRRPSELARHPDLREPLVRVSASRALGGELLRAIVEEFALAWIECEPDGEGVCDLGRMIQFLRDRPSYRVHRPLPAVMHADWDRFGEVLAAVPDLIWHVSGGHFEWSLPPREAGLFTVPCDSDGFQRFVDRVLAAQPRSFDDFEGLLP
ncbi:hypothetical protein R5W23_005881 [Gemmata sp. JC673]|uniref:Uncharacterized protein n=1 Tax=Gemmata algarum TaxID=2975278 RepID=A0ABU5EUT2_9BACT|nr:hypothetical protein [Gemmata algarum]MDY3558724.1 hypothetical protein [Gemmata algarum]